MKPLDKHPYEPPVAEIFELKTECVLQTVSRQMNYDKDPTELPG